MVKYTPKQSDFTIFVLVRNPLPFVMFFVVIPAKAGTQFLTFVTSRTLINELTRLSCSSAFVTSRRVIRLDAAIQSNIINTYYVVLISFCRPRSLSLSFPRRRGTSKKIELFDWIAALLK